MPRFGSVLALAAPILTPLSRVLSPLALVLALIATALLPTSPALADDPIGLHGIWAARPGDFDIVLILDPEGTGSLDNWPFSYSVKGRQLVVTRDLEDGEGVTTTYGFDLAGDRLTIRGGNFEESTDFTRTTWELMPGAGLDPVGTWLFRTPNGDIPLILDPDGSAHLNGEPGRWRFEGGRLALRGNPASDFQWVRNDARLTLVGENGSRVVYSAGLTETTFVLKGGDLRGPITLERAPDLRDSAPPSEPSR